MTLHITENRDGFAGGQTTITRYDDQEDNTGIALAVMKLAGGESVALEVECETAWLLMRGKVHGTAGDLEFSFERTSLFDESSSCIHVSANTAVDMHCTADTEFTVYRCDNTREFETRIYRPEDVANEPRGKGQVNDRCLRYVRTIFDGSNAPAEAELVLGEVVTFQGGWSSYPPHHHPQPEIYHYRFTEPQGYGHAELGEEVLKVRNYDTVKILDEKDHAQCAAPGYGMYYSWVIRHLPDNPYTVPEFTEEHAWVMNPEHPFWDPDRQ
ncbi:MAG: 5-deoxy-glucuronate isomerase [Gammaproteobacteria bacterium]|nr:5-deoxy-glucuronate isomerase [Gammaproteobacteria bacterium]MYF10564.1 5-deoxy-glucuronate isomerase [Gammaproteobacteria bacterium]MYG12023.1 5-deoxy-glucuronate isomerase [Gammaproteobacteria bacterium]MYK29974.1 5-deoxy-glucuronate isomerase [Gammaproteobacteria bacterium]